MTFVKGKKCAYECFIRKPERFSEFLFKRRLSLLSLVLVPDVKQLAIDELGLCSNGVASCHDLGRFRFLLLDIDGLNDGDQNFRDWVDVTSC